jgi:hypothetical protein
MIYLVLVLRGLYVEGLSVLIRYGSGSDLLLPRGWSREGHDAVVGGGGGALRLVSQGSHGTFDRPSLTLLCGRTRERQTVVARSDCLHGSKEAKPVKRTL